MMLPSRLGCPLSLKNSNMGNPGRDLIRDLSATENSLFQHPAKAESVAAKHWHRNLLPALSYHSVMVVEGPNDFAALHSLALRQAKELDKPLPAAQGVSRRIAAC